MTDGPNPALTGFLDRLASGEDLTRPEAAALLAEIMEGRADPAQTAGVLVALRAKGVSVDEVVGLAETMRRLALPVTVDRPQDLLDTAGTGGGCSTFNVSTAAALVAAAAGARVAKHGNRSSTSRCGSADVLEALGARIDLDPDGVAACIEEVGFGFMFAPRHHAAMRHVVAVRRALGVRTVFNILGPLTNPAAAGRQRVGTADARVAPVLAGALHELGCVHGLVVSSDDGLDELSVAGPTALHEVRADGVISYTVTPDMFGLGMSSLDEVAGGEPSENAATVRALFDGAGGAGRDLLLFNAGAALFAAGVAAHLQDGVDRARAAVDTGAAARTLDAFVDATRRHAGLAPAA